MGNSRIRRRLHLLRSVLLAYKKKGWFSNLLSIAITLFRIALLTSITFCLVSILNLQCFKLGSPLHMGCFSTMTITVSLFLNRNRNTWLCYPRTSWFAFLWCRYFWMIFLRSFAQHFNECMYLYLFTKFYHVVYNQRVCLRVVRCLELLILN